MYTKPIIEVIEFANEEVVMNLVASSDQFPPQPQPGGSDGLDNSANV